MKPAKPPLLYTENVESVPVGEPQAIAKVVDAVKRMLVKDLVDEGKIRADVHVKTHGYAKAELKVLPNLPEELAQGLFASPGQYSATVRFSNSANVPMPDIAPDGRGMAIKVTGVDGELISVDQHSGPAQDFVLINHPVFFAANAVNFLRLERVLEETEENPLAATKALTGGDWNPLNWHWNEMITAAGIAGKIPKHPANQTYFSMSPFRYGKYMAKFRVQPTTDRSDSFLKMLERFATESDAIRLALEETLSQEALHFEFQVQLCTSETTMPIEDATVVWPENESLFRTVAQLTLPQQDIAPNRTNPEFTNLAFNVWHALADHRPLGGINRVRREVYPVSAAWRRQQS